MEKHKRLLILTNELLGDGIFRDIAVMLSDEFDMRVTIPTRYTMKKIRQSGIFDCVIDLTNTHMEYDTTVLSKKYISFKDLRDIQHSSLMITAFQYDDFKRHAVINEVKEMVEGRNFIFINDGGDNSIYEKALTGKYNDSYIINPDTYWGVTIFHVNEHKMNMCLNVKIFNEMYKTNLIRFMVEYIKKEVNK